MSLETLREQRTQLLLQRAAFKDRVEQAEQQLGQVNAAIQALEQHEQDETPDE